MGGKVERAGLAGIASSGWVDYVIIAFAVDVLVGGPYVGGPRVFAVERRRTLLNTKAAEYVFQHQDKLGRFTLIPTDTTKKLEWTVQGLAKLSPAVGVRSLTFHGRYDPWEMISVKENDGAPHSTQEFLAWRAEWGSDPRYSSPDSKGYKAVMADLTGFLAAFTEVFKDFHTIWGSLKQTSIKVAMEQTISDKPMNNCGGWQIRSCSTCTCADMTTSTYSDSFPKVTTRKIHARRAPIS
jgi:hypothetical protein